MTRVSLKEAYDNKDVVAQIYAIRDTAESAVDTSEQAVTTANTASDHVDALVPQVEGAVESANSASASAQASAQTVAGYENRLGAVESGLSQTESDLNAVTLRVTTAEGNIVTIQGRVTALETADGQNVKINRINDYAVGLTGNQLIEGTKLTGSFFLASNMNITNSEKAFAVASGYGIHHYGGAFFLVMVRDILYFVRLHSGSSATIHSAEVSNPLTGEVVDKTTLTWSMGVVISDGVYYLVLKGIEGNKTATVRYLGGSQGGTVSLTMNPISVVDANTLGTPEYFW